MSIEILPARLANQIAAGEVVERPASVIKELVENSLDAGATKIHIDIDKGGAKRIRISDNGSGIPKEELTLALSRHATSKIKDLSDLEAIASLGFRGEALASISSVARLTLTSKPPAQSEAWQAYAEGRDMAVTIKPAAHPDGTTIEVNDLFFNTPARRKFMRTEKTEFTHIDEIVRRIALARFDVTFTLTHNGKMIRQYRAAKTAQQSNKRVAMIAGQKFIDNALEIDCLHQDLHLSGWIAKPSFYRTTNDLCYSYVNGRMMRDKLINHAIRQAYADLLPSDGYPAFVLFLTLDFKDVDVNVHPAKHEVRFHQGRYVHDFIFSVCHQALQSQSEFANSQLNSQEFGDESISGNDVRDVGFKNEKVTDRDYVKPLHFINDSAAKSYITQNPQTSQNSRFHSDQRSASHVSANAAELYQQLMTPISSTETAADVGHSANQGISTQNHQPMRFLTVVDEKFGVIKIDDELRLVKLKSIAEEVMYRKIKHQWESGIVKQPLLLPVMTTLPDEEYALINTQQEMFEKLGISVECKQNNKIQIRQFPAILRNKDVSGSLLLLLQIILKQHSKNDDVQAIGQFALAKVSCSEEFDHLTANQLFINGQEVIGEEFYQQLRLNSEVIDLTSAISQLN